MSAIIDRPADQQEALRPRPRPGQAVVAILLSSLGLLVQAAGYALTRPAVDPVAGLALFYVGLLVLVLPCSWVLLGRTVPRGSRLLVAQWLGVGFGISMWLCNPTVLGRFDELLHEGTLWQLVETRELFSSNSMLPISPYFPGMELFAASVHWLTGLPTVPSALVVVAASRVALIAGLFLVAERLTRSERGAGVAVLLYVTSPQMYSFNAQFAYQTLALALAVVAVHFTLRAIDEKGSSARWAIGFALVSLAGLAITHHLTSWIMLGVLGVAAAWLWITGHRAAARLMALVAAADVVIVAVWTAIVGRRLFDYLSPLFEQAAAQLVGIVAGSSTPRHLFSDGGGDPSPLWEQLVMLGSSMVWCLMLAAALWTRLRGRTDILRGRHANWLVCALAAVYPGLLLARFSPAASQVSDRATTFVFLAMSIVVAGWFVHRAGSTPRIVAGAVFGLLLLGGVILGSGPDWSRVPGPWLPSADQRSVDASTLSASEWVRDHLDGQYPIATDRVDADLVLAIGRQQPVTPLATAGTNLQHFFTADTVENTRWEFTNADIRLVMVDRRLAGLKPYIAAYFEPNDGQSAAPPTVAQLTKFATFPGVTTLYDNGDVVIYDVSAVRGLPPVRVSMDAAPARELDTFEPVPLVAAVVGIAAGLLLWRRRRTGEADEASKPREPADRTAAAIVATTLPLMLFGLFMVITGLPMSWLTVIECAVALTLVGALARALHRRQVRLRIPPIPRASAFVAVLVAVAVGVAGGASIASADSVLDPSPGTVKGQR